MTVRRLIAIVFIFGCVTVAWMILGSSIFYRTEMSDTSRWLGDEVEELWGSEHVQRAPVVVLPAHQQGPHATVDLESSTIFVDLELEHRQKGLLWYATYEVSFDGTYTFQNPLDEVVTATVSFAFPAAGTIYDGFEFRVKEQQARPIGSIANELQTTVELAPGEMAEIHVAYTSRGKDQWLYSFADGITTVKDFALVVNTDFAEYDFPSRTISASEKTRTPRGWELEWQFNNLVADFDVGVKMPEKRNPGPMASRMSFFAPVSLLFLFTVLVVLGAVKDTSLHPMHYFFLGASFFAFHLLFAYLVDHLLLELSFVVAAIVSLLLVISYLWRVAGWRFALREGGVSQFLFLVMFSYAFFFEGYTGLVVTVGSIFTLAVLMQITAKVNWEKVFRKKEIVSPEN